MAKKNNKIRSTKGENPSNYTYATGKVAYRLTNDYMFRAVFQTNTKALTGLLCSLLHLSPKKVRSVRVTNPIKLGSSIDAKTYILDITVALNNNTYINLEMQVVNQKNWPERSLSYLCRTFGHLSKGEDYSNVKPVIQICFLDYTLFKQYPEFYATYQMMNIKNYNIYSDKLALSVVDLSQITMATEEDKANGVDRWAALFVAKEWEEVKALAQNNEYIEEATQTMYELTTDEEIRLQCEAREEYARIQRGMERMAADLKEKSRKVKQKEKEVEEKSKIVEERDREVEEKNREVEEKNREVEEKNREVEEKSKIVEERDREVEEKSKIVEERDREVEEKSREVEEKSREVEEKNREVEEKNREVEEKNRVLEQKILVVDEQIRKIDNIKKDAEEKVRRAEEKAKVEEIANAEVKMELERLRKELEALKQQVQG